MTSKRATKRRAPRAELSARLRANARELWLAGLGAVAKAGAERRKFIETLVAERSKAQEHSKAAAQKALSTLKRSAELNRLVKDLKGLQGKATAGAGKLQGLVQDQTQLMLSRLGLPTRKEFEALSHKIDMLAASLQAGGAAATKRRARRAA